MLTSGVRARRALCRFASPLPRPGPRCRSVAAGLPAMRPYPSAAPVTTPSNKPSAARISGTESSAATKCISDVPGFVKHTSTSPSTRVRISACAPFMVCLRGSVEEGARVENAVRVERGLDAAHELDLGRVLELEVVALLFLAHTVLTRDGAAERHARLEQPAQHLVALLGVGLEHREVDVAVAGVTAPGDQRLIGLPELGDLGHELRYGGARNHDVDDVVGVVRLGDPERLLAGVDELHRGLGRQHVHVERAELGELLAEGLHVLVEPARLLDEDVQ